MSETYTVLVWAIVVVVVVLGGLVAVVAIRGKRMPGEHVFRASRLSKGNHLFPAQVAVAHMAHIASVDIVTNLFFSHVVIETSGGSDPVRCNGHHKRDAIEMKRLINEYQSAYYKGAPAPPPPPRPTA